MIDVSSLVADFEAVEAVHPPYESPGSTSFNAIINGTGVDCSGLFCAVYSKHHQSIYHGSNTIARKYVQDREKLTSTKQLFVGAAVFKHQYDGGEPAKYKPDGLGDFHHIGLCCSVNPLRIVHASSAAGMVTTDTSIKKWSYVARLNGVSYGTETKVDKQEVDGMYTASVNCSSLRIRSAPDTNSEIMGSLPRGTVVKCSERTGEWFKLADASGYIHGKYVDIISQEEEQPETQPEELPFSDDLAARVEWLEQAVKNITVRLSALEVD